MLRIAVVETNSKCCHLVNGLEETRLDHSEFMKVVSGLRQKFDNRLRDDLYIGQPVYEYLEFPVDVASEIQKIDSRVVVKVKKYVKNPEA